VRHGTRLLTAQPLDGYLTVTLYNRGGRKKRRIHRLVALAFKPRVSGCNTVNHKDGNKLNNVADNLEWTTTAGNIKHAWASGLMWKQRG